MSVILLGNLLQEVKSLLEHPQQILLKLYRYTVLGHQLIDARHGKHSKAATFLTQERVLAAAIDTGHLSGPGVAAEAGKMKDGSEERRGDARGQRDPAKEVG